MALDAISLTISAINTALHKYQDIQSLKEEIKSFRKSLRVVRSILEDAKTEVLKTKPYSNTSLQNSLDLITDAVKEGSEVMEECCKPKKLFVNLFADTYLGKLKAAGAKMNTALQALNSAGVTLQVKTVNEIETANKRIDKMNTKIQASMGKMDQVLQILKSPSSPSTTLQESEVSEKLDRILQKFEELDIITGKVDGLEQLRLVQSQRDSVTSDKYFRDKQLMDAMKALIPTSSPTTLEPDITTTSTFPSTSFVISQESKKKRYDVFISFNGGQLLDEKTNVRELLEQHLIGGENILHSKWKSIHVQEGTRLSVFTDQKLFEDSGRLEEIFTALLQTTQGGGVIVLLLTPGYFTRKWCLTELKCAYDLIKADQQRQQQQASTNHRSCRLCLVRIGMDIDDISNQPFIQQYCPDLLQWNIQQIDIRQINSPIEFSVLAAEIADKIIARCKDYIVPGSTQRKTMLNLCRMIGRTLKPRHLTELKAILGDVPNATNCKMALIETQCIEKSRMEPLKEFLEDLTGDDTQQCLVWITSYLEKWESNYYWKYSNWNHLLQSFHTNLEYHGSSLQNHHTRGSTMEKQHHGTTVQTQSQPHGSNWETHDSSAVPKQQPVGIYGRTFQDNSRQQEQHAAGRYFRSYQQQSKSSSSVKVDPRRDDKRDKITVLQKEFDSRLDVDVVESMTRNELTQLLASQPVGSFFFRLSKSSPFLVIQVRMNHDGVCDNLLIQEFPGQGFASYNTNTGRRDSEIRPSVAQLIHEALPECKKFFPISFQMVKSLPPSRQ